MFIQLSSKTTKMLYAGQIEQNEVFTYQVKVMKRHGETLHFAFSDEDDMNVRER